MEEGKEIGIFDNKSSVWKPSARSLPQRRMYIEVSFPNKDNYVIYSHYTSVWNVQNTHSFCKQKSVVWLSDLTVLDSGYSSHHCFLPEADAFVCSGTGMYPTACFCTAIILPSQLLAKSDRKIASTQGCICIWVAVTRATIWPMQQPARPLHPVCFRTEQLAICLFSICNWRYRPGVHITHTTLACHLFVKSKIMTTSHHHQLHMSFH